MALRVNGAETGRNGPASRTGIGAARRRTRRGGLRDRPADVPAHQAAGFLRWSSTRRAFPSPRSKVWRHKLHLHAEAGDGVDLVVDAVAQVHHLPHLVGARCGGCAGRFGRRRRAPAGARSRVSIGEGKNPSPSGEGDQLTSTPSGVPASAEPVLGQALLGARIPCGEQGEPHGRDGKEVHRGTGRRSGRGRRSISNRHQVNPSPYRRGLFNPPRASSAGRGSSAGPPAGSGPAAPPASWRAAPRPPAGPREARPSRCHPPGGRPRCPG